MRQAPVIGDFDPRGGVSVSTLRYEYPAGYKIPEHAHGSDQLVSAVSGVMEVTSESSVWLIPQGFALWIPARTFYRISMPCAVSMRTLYFRRGLVKPPALANSVLHVPPLLRELILEAVRVGELRARRMLERALRDLLILHLESASSVPISVALPKEPRALALAQLVLAQGGLTRSLTALCQNAGVSARTFQRIFRAEMGTTFETWRRQVRLMKAVELLVARHSVKEIAYLVGYRQPSALVETFRRNYGMTPRVWVGTVMGDARARS